MTAGVLIVAVAGSLWVFMRTGSGDPIDDSLQLGAEVSTLQETPSRPAPRSEEPKKPEPTPATPSPSTQPPPTTEKPASPETKPTTTDAPQPAPTTTPATVAKEQPRSNEPVAALLESAKSAMDRGDVLAARKIYSELLQRDLDAATLTTVRDKAEQIAMDTILGPRIVPGDPLVDRHVVDAGDLLTKIATANKVPVGVLARINGMADPNKIGIGQTLKVIKGPFRAVVDKEHFTLDVYLGDTFVRQFKVGLGADSSTPTGEWVVQNKLENPRYYPPRGGPILAADDPKNPLGERWIGLRGVKGEALGQERYGIHGTIEPETIGKNASLGCVRLKNEDVEQLYSYLVEQHSTVIVKDSATRATSGVGTASSTAP